MNLAELWDLLDQHDWLHPFADDPRTYRQGAAEQDRLKALAMEIEGGLDLFHAFQDYGDPDSPRWNQRPIRPTPDAGS